MTIDKERLRVLAEAATGWSNCDKVWPHAEYDEISVLGAICEEGVQYPVAEIDADTYGDDGDSLKLAQFYAGANPAAVLALLAENAALAAEVERLRKDAGHTEPMTRFCPGCGSVGDVPKKYRDCCPDGSNSRVIPEKLAKQCHDLFQGALQAAMADKGGAAS